MKMHLMIIFFKELSWKADAFIIFLVCICVLVSFVLLDILFKSDQKNTNFEKDNAKVNSECYLL